jgi:hypothetical protein
MHRQSRHVEAEATRAVYCTTYFRCLHTHPRRWVPTCAGDDKETPEFEVQPPCCWACLQHIHPQANEMLSPLQEAGPMAKQLLVDQRLHLPSDTYTHAHMRTCAPLYTHAHMHTCTHAHMHTCTHAHMHTCTHAHMHTCAQHMHNTFAHKRTLTRGTVHDGGPEHGGPQGRNQSR